MSASDRALHGLSYAAAHYHEALGTLIRAYEEKGQAPPRELSGQAWDQTYRDGLSQYDALLEDRNRSLDGFKFQM